MNRQKKLLGIGAVVLIALAAVFLGGCTNPASPEPAKYSVSYDGNGNTGGTAPVDATTYTEGTSVTVLANTNLVKTGNGFQGWATTSSATSPEYVAGATFAMPAKNLTLYAVWAKAKTWTVTFDSNGGSAVESQTVTDGQKASEPTSPTRAEYAFNGWYTSNAYDTKWDFATNTVTAAVTLYAKWGPIPTYTITYNANGATGDVPVDITQYRAASAVTIAGKGKLVVDGKTFLGWAETNTATTAAYVPGTISMPARNLTLYAVWTDQQCLTVTFDSNGGSSVDFQTVLSGSTVKEPTAPTKEGSTFDGWYTSTDYSTKWDFATKTVTTATVLYAKWKTATYTLEYTTDGNGTISRGLLQENSYSQTVNYGSNGPSLTATPKTGYKFDSWSDGVTTASRTDFAIKADLKVSAYFKKIQYTLTYSAEANGSISGTKTQTVAYGESGTAVTAVADTGYRFAQWSDGKTDATRTDANVMATRTITAQFVKDGAIGIVFTGIADETIDLSQSDDQALSKAKKDKATVSLTSSFDSYEWKLDSNTYASSTNSTYTIDSAYTSVGVHTITLIVTKNGAPYSKQLRFRIVY